MRISKIDRIMGYKNAWDFFKIRRKKDKDFGHDNLGYLTVLQRESMLDDILKIIVG